MDYFWYSLPDEDFENKWEVIGWPHKITLQIDATNEYLNEETDKFQKIQFNDEINLTEKIEQMTVQVTKMSAYTDFNSVSTVLLLYIFFVYGNDTLCMSSLYNI